MYLLVYYCKDIITYYLFVIYTSKRFHKSGN